MISLAREIVTGISPAEASENEFYISPGSISVFQHFGF